jgi:hypothetical protein
MPIFYHTATVLTAWMLYHLQRDPEQMVTEKMGPQDRIVSVKENCRCNPDRHWTFYNQLLPPHLPGYEVTT